MTTNKSSAFNEIPPEIRLHTYSFLSNSDLSNVATLSKLNNNDLNNVYFWRQKCIQEFGCDIPVEKQNAPMQFYRDLKSELALAISCASAPNHILPKSNAVTTEDGAIVSHNELFRPGQKKYPLITYKEIVKHQKPFAKLSSIESLQDYNLIGPKDRQNDENYFYVAEDDNFKHIYNNLIINHHQFTKEIVNLMQIYFFHIAFGPLLILFFESKTAAFIESINIMRNQIYPVISPDTKMPDLSTLGGNQLAEQITWEAKLIGQYIRLLIFLSLQKSTNLFENIIKQQPAWSEMCLQVELPGFSYQRIPSLLYAAIRGGSLSSVAALVSKGADVNSIKYLNNEPEVIEPGEVDKFFDMKFEMRNSQSPLSLAIDEFKQTINRLEDRSIAAIIHFLLENGASPTLACLRDGTQILQADENTNYGLPVGDTPGHFHGTEYTTPYEQCMQLLNDKNIQLSQIARTALEEVVSKAELTMNVSNRMPR